MWEIPMSRTERKFLSAVVAERGKTNITTSVLQKELGMSEENLRYYNSSIIPKVYSCIVPELGVALLRFLSHRGLLTNFKNEVRKQEAELRDPEELNCFYFTVFELSLRIIYSNVDTKYSRELAKKYISACQKIKPDEELACDLRIKQAHFLQQIGKGLQRKSTIEAFQQILLSAEEGITTSANFYAHYAYHEGWIHYKAYTDPTSIEVEEHLRQLIEKFPPEIDKFFPETRAIMENRFIQLHERDGDPEKVYNMLHTFWGKKANALLPAHLQIQFAYYAILTGRYTEAETLCDMMSQTMFAKPYSVDSTGLSLLYLTLYLQTDRYDLAKKYLDLTGDINRGKNRHVIYEMYRRLGDTGYYVLAKDYEHAERTISRNIAWLRKEGNDLPDSWAFNAIIIIKEYLEAHHERRPIAKKYIALSEKYGRTGVNAAVTILLKKIRKDFKLEEK